MMQSMEYRSYLFHVSRALDSSPVKRFCVLHIISQLDTSSCIEVSHWRIDTHLTCLHGVLFLVASYHHTFRTISWHTQDILHLSFAHLKVLVRHTSYLCNLHLILYLLMRKDSR